jgi:hypothetical protein
VEKRNVIEDGRTPILDDEEKKAEDCKKGKCGCHQDLEDDPTKRLAEKVAEDSIADN